MERENQFIGESGAFLDAVEQASRAAPLNRSVLIIGERGTGKELIAERLHRLGLRWDKPMITLNCAALPETLIEAELFGHEAGAFTGATRARAGAFEEADGGTLFLDELATLSAAAQERLLRAVEYGEVARIGSNTPLRVDVRIVAATNENLPGLVERNQFRADLLDRLSFEVVTLPPLRAREDDVMILADYFGRRMAVELDWPRWPGFGEKATDVLASYDWPGNVRELRNVTERAVYRWDEPARPVDTIQLDPFESPWQVVERPEEAKGNAAASAEDSSVAPVATPSPPAPVGDFKAAVESYEKQLLEAALESARFNQRRTAKSLGLSYDQLRHALKRHALIG